MKIILTRGAKKYLKRRMEYNEKLILEELHSLLKPYEEKLPKDFKIVIKEGDIPNGQFRTPKKIIITSRHVLNYFKTHAKLFMGERILETIGHEIGHGKAYIGIPMFFVSKSLNEKLASKKEKFKYRLVETFCDNYSVKFTGLTREEHSYILYEHIFEDKNPKTDFLHPTWQDRSTYVLKPFNENLIRQVAKDNGFTNEKEIQKQIDYYNKVLENDGFIKKTAILKTGFNFILSSILILTIIFGLCFLIKFI